MLACTRGPRTRLQFAQVLQSGRRQRWHCGLPPLQATRSRAVVAAVAADKFITIVDDAVL
jgi:hypothetical protein